MGTLITIYQVKDEHTREHGFMGLDELRKVATHPYQGEVIDMRRYAPVMQETQIDGAVLFGRLMNDKPLELLETLFRLSNEGNEAFIRSYGFEGRSISVGDIVRIRRDGADAFYYCDTFGWEPIEVKEVPHWVQVGMYATGTYATDGYPFEVIKVSATGKVVTIRELVAENAEGFDYYENQAHTFKRNPNGEVYTVRQHKSGAWRTPTGMYVTFGSARKYEDPHF